MDARIHLSRMASFGAPCLFVLWASTFATHGEAQEVRHRASAKVTYSSQQYLGKGVTQAELSNGTVVLVKENHSAPVATVRCYVRNTGSAYEGKYLGTGISHMLEHLVAGGTTTIRPESEIQRLVDGMGGQTNAFTTSDLTGYYIDCPAAQVDVAISLVAESMQYAEIPEDEYVREMGVVQRELEMGKVERRRVLYQAMKSLVYTEHPIRHPTIGYLPVVQSVKREEVIAFYKDRYVPQNLIFVVAGDVATESVMARILNSFQGFQRTTERSVVLPLEPQQASARSTRIEMEGQTTSFSVGWPTVQLQNPDLYALDVASYLIANGDSSRLGFRLKIEQPLAIGVTSSSYTPGFVPGWFDVTVQCEPQNLPACRAIIREEIERLKSEPVKEAELAKVKRQKAAEHVFGQQTVQDQADALAFSLLSTGDAQFDDRYVEGIQKVTAEQVQAVAEKYLLDERSNTVTIAPIGSKQETTEGPDQIASGKVIRKTLSNGLTVLLKRHNVNPIVSIQAFVNGGVLSDSDAKSGRASITAELMMRGTEKYSGREISEYFDSVGGTMETDSQRNTTFVQCQVLKDDFTQALDYVHQVLLHPRFNPEDFAKVKQQQLGRIAARKADPQAEIIDFWKDQLPKSSPYHRGVLGKQETISKLTLEDCSAFHSECFVPSNMILSVFGDIDPDEVLKQLEASFGKQPSASAKQAKYAVQPETSQGGSKKLTTQRANAAMVIMSYATPSLRDEKSAAAIEVMNGLLTGGSGAGGRLFNELRGERLVYYVFGAQLAGPAPGFFFFMAQTRPETVDEVVTRIRRNLARIEKEGIPKDELTLIKQKLIAANAQSNTTASSQAFQATLDELMGMGFDYDESYAQRISQVTSDDIKALIQRYFQKPLVVTSGPE